MQVSKLVASKTFQRLPLFIRQHSVFLRISKIEKPFPSIGLPNSLEKCETDFDGKPAYIGFSSTGVAGTWDLATMSMRGVCSCMHWDNIHSQHLVGSVTDPFLGMIYITDNKRTPYGISFQRRALVRMVRNRSTLETKLLIDRIYKDTGNTNPAIYANRDPNCDTTLALFKKFLESKLDGKYKVMLPQDRYAEGHSYSYVIPKSTSVDIVSSSYRSMVDCGLGYAAVNDDFIKKFADQN